MKVLYLVLGLGLAAVGLAAPSTAPYPIITTVGDIPLARSQVVRVGVTSTNTPPPPRTLAAKISKYASDALGLLKLPESPIFVFDENRAEVIADPNGDLVAMSYERKANAMVRNKLAEILHPYPTLRLRDGLPFIILTLSLSAVVACSWLRKLVPISF